MDKIKEESDIIDYTFRDNSILFHETNEVSLFPKVSSLENRVIELYPIEKPKCIRIYKKDAKALSRFFGLNKSRDEEIKKLREALLMHEPWSLIDITKKLLEAADILLHQYDYDGDCWEQIQTAWERGKEALKELNSG